MRKITRFGLFPPICALALFLGAVVTACGGEDEQLSASCGAFDGFDSYRYSIGVKLQLPGLQVEGAKLPPAIDPYGTSLAALLSDFKIDGAFVAPDRRQAILDFRGDQMELREVGEQRWERFGEAWGPLPAGSPHVADLAPKLVCADLVTGLAPGLVRSNEDDEDVGGVRARQYSIDGTNVDQLRRVLGLQEDAQLPSLFHVDVWFANDGDWPVRVDIRSQTADAQMGAGAVQFLMELRDLNDKGIAIDPPPTGAGG